MLGTQRRIDPAQHDLGSGTIAAQIFHNFPDSQVPVSHHGLHEGKIKRSVFLKKLLEMNAGKTVPPEAAGNRIEDAGGWHHLSRKLAPPPEIAAEVLVKRWVPAVEIIEQAELSAIAQIAGHAQKTIRLQPKIVGRKVVNRWIDEQNLRRHE